MYYYDDCEDEYAGTYTHDVTGFSDEDIDTIFDSEPNAYWNIDFTPTEKVNINLHNKIFG